MRLRIRLSLGLCLVAALFAFAISRRGVHENSQLTAGYEKVRQVISPEGYARLKPIHRRMLAHLVEQHVKATAPVVAACWDTSTGDQETIDAFNAAITLGQTTGTEFQQTTRWSTTALSGGGLGQGQPTTITYSFCPDGTFIPSGTGEPGGNSDLFSWLNGIYGSPTVWQQIFAEEFNRWSAMTGITYVYEPNDDGLDLFSASGQAGVRGDVRIGAKMIDGNSNVLAYNYFPNNGDMVLDSADSFYNNVNSNSIRLRNVISHEHGHGLGMLHVCPTDGTKLMEPFINTGFLGPQHDEILNGQRHYGDALEPNDSVAAASDLGALSGGMTSVTGVSTDDNSDVDVYAFTTSSPHTLDVTLRPVGMSYLEGPQTASCNGGTTFDSLTVSNLSLEVIDSDGTTVLGFSNVNPAGANEALTGILLPNPGQYYVRITPDSTDNVQGYEIDINLGTFVPNSFAIQFPDGRPTFIDAQYVNPLRIETVDFSGTPDPANAFVHYRVNGGPWIQDSLVDLGNSFWWANLPLVSPYAQVDYYIEMFPMGGGSPELSPASAPALYYSAEALQENTVTVFQDNFENDLGWTVISEASVTGGIWERGVPAGDGTRGDPLSDADGSGQCYLTENGAGNTDVDGGRTRLISPVIDLGGFASARLRFSFWYSNDTGNNPNQDPFDIHVRESSTSPWVLLESYNANANAWLQREFLLENYINLTSTVQVRFRAEDTGGGSIVEAAVDAVSILATPLENPIGPWAKGTVGVTQASGPVSILFANSSDGGPSREVFVPVNTPYVVTTASPPGFNGAGYAMFAKLGRPLPSDVFPITTQAGSLCIVPQVASPLDPNLFTVAWLYPNPPVGVLDPFATPTPWFSVSQGFPFPITVSLQVVVSEGPQLRCSNLLILNIQ